MGGALGLIMRERIESLAEGSPVTCRVYVAQRRGTLGDFYRWLLPDAENDPSFKPALKAVPSARLAKKKHHRRTAP